MSARKRTPEAGRAVSELWGQGLSVYQIRRRLRGEGLDLSITTICRIAQDLNLPPRYNGRRCGKNQDIRQAVRDTAHLSEREAAPLVGRCKGRVSRLRREMGLNRPRGGSFGRTKTTHNKELYT